MNARTTFAVMLMAMGTLCAEIKHDPGTGAKGGKGSALSGGPVKKVAVNGTVLQVLDEGLLFSCDGGTFLLTGHPDAKKLADGDEVNCYVVKTEKTFQYTDVKGAKRTARIYKFLNRRIGK